METAPATLKKSSFPVTGMSCAACAVGVESVLKAEAGVSAAAVNYANATVMVTFDPAKTDPPRLQQSLQSIGYDIIIADAPTEAADLAAAHQHTALIRLRNRMWAAVLLSLPLVLLGMVFMHWPYANSIMWALATPVVFVFGRQFFVHAYQQARHGRTNMDTLVALSTGIAYSFSVFNTLYPEFWTRRGLHADVYFEAAAVIVAFLLVGKYLEERAKAGASQAIKKLMGLQPKTVTLVLPGGQEATVAVADVLPGDRLRVKPGDKVPVDGRVVAGASFVDESMISGEPIPVEKTSDSQVLAGTLNQTGSFEFIAEKVGGETLLAQIIQAVQAAQGSKPPVQRLVDRIAAIFVPVVMGIALLSFVLWAVLAGRTPSRKACSPS